MIAIKIDEDIHIYDEDKEIVIGPKKLRAILAYFAMNKSVSRDELAYIFFDENKSNIRNAIYQINKLFEQYFIINRNSTILEINPDLEIEYEIINNRSKFLNQINIKNNAFKEWKLSLFNNNYYVHNNVINKIIINYMDLQETAGYIIEGDSGVGKSEFINNLYETKEISNIIRIKCIKDESDFSLNILYLMLRSIGKTINKDLLKVFHDINYLNKRAFDDENNLLNIHYIPIADLIIESLTNEIDKKILVIIEDIQWIDAKSLKIINILLEESLSPIMFVCTYKTNSRMIDFSDEFQKIKLKNWTQDQLLEYIQHNYIEYENQVEKIYKLTNGNPLLITLHLKNGYDETQTINDYFKNWYSNLDEYSLDILKFISVYSFAPKYIELIKYFDKDSINTINLLITNGYLYHRIVNDELYVLFVHDQLKEVVYETMEVDEKSMLHEYVAANLPKFGSLKNIYDLYYHYSKSNNIEKQIEYQIKLLSLVSSYTYAVFPSTNKFEFITLDNTNITSQLNDIGRTLDNYKSLTNNKFIMYDYLTLINRYKIIAGIIDGVEESILKLIEYRDENDKLVTSYFLMVYHGLNTNNVELINEYLDKLKMICDLEKLPVIKRISGYSQSILGNYPLATFTLNEAIELSSQMDKEFAETNLVACYINLGEVYIMMGDYKRALKNLLRGQRIVSDSMHYIVGSNLIDCFLAICYYHLNDTKLAKIHINNAIDYYNTSNLWWKRDLCEKYAKKINGGKL